MAPSRSSPVVTYFHNATRSLRASAVMMTRSLCPSSSSVCKHYKLIFVIDATRATGLFDRRNYPITLQIVGADLVGSAWHDLLGGEDALVNQPSDAVARNAERRGGFRHREPVTVLGGTYLANKELADDLFTWLAAVAWAGYILFVFVREIWRGRKPASSEEWAFDK